MPAQAKIETLPGWYHRATVKSMEFQLKIPLNNKKANNSRSVYGFQENRADSGLLPMGFRRSGSGFTRIGRRECFPLPTQTERELNLTPAIGGAERA
jgi:hypothetical protein